MPTNFDADWLNPLDNGERNEKIPSVARVFFALQQKRWRRR